VKNDEINEEENLIINSTTLKVKARNLLAIMFMLVVILIWIYVSSMKSYKGLEKLSLMFGIMVTQPFMALLAQAESIPLLISVILAMSSSVSICKILLSNDYKKISRSFVKLKIKAIIMFVFDCIVCLWLGINGFPAGYSDSLEYGMVDGIIFFIISYFYSIFNIAYTGILSLFVKLENKKFKQD